MTTAFVCGTHHQFLIPCFLGFHIQYVFASQKLITWPQIMRLRLSLLSYYLQWCLINAPLPPSTTSPQNTPLHPSLHQKSHGKTHHSLHQQSSPPLNTHDEREGCVWSLPNIVAFSKCTDNVEKDEFIGLSYSCLSHANSAPISSTISSLLCPPWGMK